MKTSRILHLFSFAILTLACRKHDEPISKKFSINSVPGTKNTIPSVTIHPWCTKSPKADMTSLLLTPDSIGPISLSITRQQLRHICPTSRDTTWYDHEGEEVGGVIVSFFGKDAVLTEWSSQETLTRGTALSQPISTAYGIHIGSTMGDLRKQFPKLQAGYDDAGVYVWSETEHRLSYLLDFNASQAFPSPDDVVTRINDIPGTAIVKWIILDASP